LRNVVRQTIKYAGRAPSSIGWAPKGHSCNSVLGITTLLLHKLNEGKTLVGSDV